MTMTTPTRPGRRPAASALALCAVLLSAVLLGGCGAAAGAAGAGPVELPSAPCGRTIDQALVRGDAAVRASDARVAVGIVLIDRRGAGCISTFNAAETFPTASVVKLLIGIDLLTRDANGSGSSEQVERMLATSDDAAASALWSSGGAGGIITRTRDLIGLPSLSAPTTPGEWGSTRIDAVDVARIWQWVLDVAPAHVRAPILAGTGGAQEIAADGTDQFFGIPEALPGIRWWVKQGWGTSRGRRIINTTGVVGKDHGHILVMLTSHPIAVSFRVASRAATAGMAALRGSVD